MTHPINNQLFGLESNSLAIRVGDAQQLVDDEQSAVPAIVSLKIRRVRRRRLVSETVSRFIVAVLNIVLRQRMLLMIIRRGAGRREQICDIK